MSSGHSPPRTLVVVGVDWSVRAAGHAEVSRPVAIWSHSGIIDTNTAARTAGVRVGMRRRVAQGRCPELELIAHDPLRDTRVFDPVVAALSTLTPWVEIIEPGVAALGTRGPSRYFGGDDALADTVLELVRTVLGDRSAVRVGIADGPLVARLAARSVPPGHARIIAPGSAAAFLAPIPLTVLGPIIGDTDVLGTFVRLGLPTLADVATLDPAAVTGRFGPAGIRIHRLARGTDPGMLVPTPIPDDVDEAIDLDPPETRADAVAFAARVAAETFVTRLAERGLSCAQVVVTLSTDHAEDSCRRWRLDGPANPSGKPTARAALIAERVRWQTDGWLGGPLQTRPSAGVTRVVLTPGVVAPAKGRQLGFWGGSSAARERAARAVARLEALLGPDAVRVATAAGGRHPGTEVTLVPTAVAGLGEDRERDTLAAALMPGRTDLLASTVETVPPWPGRLPAPSPALVFDEPLEIDVLDTTGHSVEVTGRGEIPHAPTSLRIPSTSPRHRTPTPNTNENRRGSGHHTGATTVAITGWAGPWPTDERWWDPPAHNRRARLQILTADGDALLVVRHDRRWWLTALYR